MKNIIAKLSQRLDYTFQNSQLLELALTHRSLGHQNNERMEFLGDSILNWIIAEALFHQFPKASEGELTRLRASLVSKPALAVMAKGFELGDYLRLGSGELKSGGFRRDSILADALEAVIAAIYLDGGVEVVKSWVTKKFAAQLKQVTTHIGKDPKTLLQEYMQARQLDLPYYVVTKTSGEAHNQYFYVECRISLLDIPVQGEGSSRRVAEQMAAQGVLDLLESKAN